MRIVVNDIAASTGGARTVLESFYNYVREFDKDNKWVFLLGSDLVNETERIHTKLLPNVKRSWIRRLFFDFVSGRQMIRSLEPDVLFSLQNTFTYGVGCPQVIYVHQPLPFQQVKKFSLWRGNERRLAIYQHFIGAFIKQSIRRADKVIVQTQWMRDAILEKVAIPADKVEKILPDLDDLKAYQYEGTSEPGAFFYPTSPNKYKNNDCINAACRILREQGISGFTVTMTLAPPSSEPEVIPIGQLPREQVLAKLARSVLIFPSYVETYGLPLAEARSLGTLVLAADLPYAREVLDGYANAYFFDPRSPSQLAQLMGKVLSGDIARAPTEETEENTRDDAWAMVIDTLEFAAKNRIGNR